MGTKRLARILTYVFCIIMAGTVYGIFVRCTGLAIPCPIRTLTGMKCPGCGVTGMCMALLRLDFKEAFHCHPMLFILLTPLLAVLAESTRTYIRDGSREMKRWQHIILYMCIALLTGYGVVRNILEI